LRLARIAPLLISFVGTALAEDDRTGRAREELERELQNMVKLPSATVEVVFDGIDSSRYKLLEASFALDEQPIPFTAGTKLLYAGEVPPGKHTLNATLIYEAPAINHGSIKYKVPGKFIFHAQRGIFMRLRARIEVDDGAEPSKRLQLVGNAETDLRAKLEDGVLPPVERKQPEADDKGAIRYGKKVASAEPETEQDAVSTNPPPKRRIGLPVASAQAASVHPVAFKRQTSVDHRNSAGTTVAARSGAAIDEEKAGSGGQSSEGDARPPPEVAASAPPSAPLVPPPPAALPPNERMGTAGMALAALAPIALLVFAFMRRRR
jgi:hypothetical protein